MDSFTVVDKAEDLVSLLQLEVWDTSPGRFYRGHGSSEYRLVPSASRDRGRNFLQSLCPHKVPIPRRSLEACQVLYEASALLQFLEFASEIGLNVPDLTTSNFDELKRFEEDLAYVVMDESRDGREFQSHLSYVKPFNRKWPSRQLHRILAIAQHSGHPTRLLDWSRSPLVAAYFAAKDCCDLLESGQSPKFLAIWRANAEVINKTFCVAKQPDYKVQKCAVVEVLGGGNPNLAAQSGVFSVLSVLLFEGGEKPLNNLSLDEYVSAESDNPSVSTSVARLYALPAEEAPSLLFLLARLGMAANRLFPTFQGVADALAEKSAYAQCVQKVPSEESDPGISQPS